MKKINIKTSMIGAVILAVALWIYTSLNMDYITVIEVPLEVNVAENKAIENPLPGSVKIEVKGKGWDLFNLQFFNTSKEVNLDLSNQAIEKNNIQVTRQQLLKSVKYLGNLEAIDVMPDYLEVRTGVSGEYSVAVKPVVKVIPKEGFTMINDPGTVPEKIKVRGNDKIVSKLDHWPTKDVVIEGVSKNFRQFVNLSDTLNTIVEKSRSYVYVTGKIDQIADKTFPDVELKIENGQAENFTISPRLFEVTVRGGVSLISKLKKEDIELYIDVNDIYSSESGVIEVKSRLPERIKLTYPIDLYVEVFRNQKTSDMLKFAEK